jgi:signal transduction histidine kinase
MICPYFDAPRLLFFVEQVPLLLYYSHFVAILTTLALGFFVILNNKSNLAGRMLFVITILFSLYTVLNLITWTNNNTDVIIFAWSFFGIIYSLICIYTVRFTHTFLFNKDLSGRLKTFLNLCFLPVIIFAASSLNFTTFDLVLCGVADENLLYANYYYGFGLICILLTLYFLYKKYKESTSADETKKTILFGVGIVFFTLSFFFTGWIASVFLFNFYSVEFYGLLSVTFFVGILAVLITKYKAFNIKLATAQALMVGIIILIGSQYFFVQTLANTWLISLTFVLATFGGYLLVKSVKQEIKQREQLELLTENLKRANDRLRQLDKMKSEFVSLASHQLRSPITSIRGFASLMIDGSFGTLPPKALEATQHIADTSKTMAMSIEDFLNVSRIESGNMVYNLTDFNLRNEVERIVDDVRVGGLKQNVLITFKSDLTKQGIVHADLGKTQQILHNLLNNSLKYTPKGTVAVLVHDDVASKKIHVDITDTGIGMSAETVENLFGKFTRAANAHKTNVHGTGLGLYIAKVMAQKMNGDITASSPGEGQGSTFRLTLPFVL